MSGMRLVRIPCLLLAFIAGAAWSAPAPFKPRAPKVAATDPATRAVALQIREQASGQLKSFYATRGFWPLWAGGGRIGPEADALLPLLTTADLDGLKPASYHVAGLRAAIEEARSGDPRSVARAELALSGAFGRYVADMRRPSKVKMAYLDAALKPGKSRLETVLRAAALPPSLKTYVAGMAWMSPHYVRLRQLLARADEAGATQDMRRRLRLNLDRARLLPGPWTDHIVVDAASARLWYYQAGKQQGTMRVVVGTAETPTPMLAGMIRYAILNPYWNVPTYLARNRIAPKMLAGASLTSLRYEALSDWSASARPLDPATIDWRAVASGAREIRLRQLPGPANSMGRVKFMFPNDQGIYLHDTPERALLAKPDRHFSNGCIRLEDAPRLGRWLLGKKLAATSKRPEQDVALERPVPVYLTYFTATSTPTGVSFLKDVYGRD